MKIFGYIHIHLKDFWLLVWNEKYHKDWIWDPTKKETKLTPAIVYSILKNSWIRISQARIIELWKLFYDKKGKGIDIKYQQFCHDSIKDSKLLNKFEVYEEHKKTFLPENKEKIYLTDDNDVKFSWDSRLSSFLYDISETNRAYLISIFKDIIYSPHAKYLNNIHKYLPILFLIWVEKNLSGKDKNDFLLKFLQDNGLYISVNPQISIRNILEYKWIHIHLWIENFIFIPYRIVLWYNYRRKMIEALFSQYWTLIEEKFLNK